MSLSNCRNTILHNNNTEKPSIFNIIAYKNVKTKKIYNLRSVDLLTNKQLWF